MHSVILGGHNVETGTLVSLISAPPLPRLEISSHTSDNLDKVHVSYVRWNPSIYKKTSYRFKIVQVELPFTYKTWLIWKNQRMQLSVTKIIRLQPSTNAPPPPSHPTMIYLGVNLILLKSSLWRHGTVPTSAWADNLRKSKQSKRSEAGTKTFYVPKRK